MDDRMPGDPPAGWDERWLAAAGRLFDAARWRQGRWHASAGRVVRLEMAPGVAIARLEGGRAVPRTVAIHPAQIERRSWEQAIDRVAAHALAAGRALAGELPEELEEAFAAAGAGLFPPDAAQLGARCTCSESRRHGELCKHIAAA